MTKKPKIIQLLSHNEGIYGLDDSGEMWYAQDNTYECGQEDIIWTHEKSQFNK